MKSTTNRYVLLGIMAFVVIFVFMDPLGWFTPKPVPTRPTPSLESLSRYGQALESEGLNAAEAVLGLFVRSDLVLVGEFLFIQEEGSFVHSLMSRLPDAGITVLAVDFLLAEDQTRVDKLLNSPVFDREAALSLLARRNPFLAAQEHLDILEEAWRLASTQHDFSLLALTRKWSDEAAAAGSPLPETLMAADLAAKVMDQRKKCLALVQRDSALTRVVDPTYRNQVESQKLGDTRRMGRILFDSYGSRVATVLFHGPWQDSASALGMGYPADGLLDAWMARSSWAARAGWPVAYDLDQSIIGDIPVSTSDYIIRVGDRVQEHQFRDFSSIYIVNGPIALLHPYGSPEGLASPAYIEEIKAFIPEDQLKGFDEIVFSGMLRKKREQVEEMLGQFSLR